MAETKRKTPVKKQSVVAESQIDMSQITPEMLAQFQAFMSMQQSLQATPQEVVERPKALDQLWLKSPEVRKREVRVTSCNQRVIYTSRKTKEVYKWLNTGDDLYLTVEEIITMDNQSHKYLRTPWLIINDDEVVEAMGLGQLYSYIKRLENIDEFLASPLEEIEEVCNNISKGYKNNLASIINQKVENKELRDIVVIRKLQDLLDKDFDF